MMIAAVVANALETIKTKTTMTTTTTIIDRWIQMKAFLIQILWIFCCRLNAYQKKCIHITFQRRSIRSQIYSDGIHSMFNPFICNMQSIHSKMIGENSNFSFFFVVPSANGGDEEIFFLNSEVDFKSDRNVQIKPFDW